MLIPHPTLTASPCPISKVKVFGKPTWCGLVKAVDSINHALAQTIARDHPGEPGPGNHIHQFNKPYGRSSYLYIVLCLNPVEVILQFTFHINILEVLIYYYICNTSLTVKKRRKFEIPPGKGEDSTDSTDIVSLPQGDQVMPSIPANSLGKGEHEKQIDELVTW